MRAHTSSARAVGLALAWLALSCSTAPAETPASKRSAAPVAHGPPPAASAATGLPLAHQADPLEPAFTAVGDRRLLDPYFWVRHARLGDADLEQPQLLALIGGQQPTQVVVLDRPLGRSRQITFGDAPVAAASFDRGAVVARRQAADGVMETERWDLTSGARLAVAIGNDRNGPALPVWSANGLHFAAASTAADGSPALSLGSREGTSTRVVALPGSGQPVGWLSAGDEVVVRFDATASGPALRRLNVITEQWQPLLPAGSASADGAEVVGELDGNEWLLLVEGVGGQRKLVSYELNSGRWSDVWGDAGASVETAVRSGPLLAITTRGAGRSALYVGRVAATLQAVPLPAASRATDLHFFDGGHRLGFTLVRDDAPSDVYAYEIKTKALERWTASETAGVGERLIAPERVSWEGPGGVPISAAYYRPRSAGPHPALLWFEGDVGDEHRARYRPLLQYLVVELGIAVIAPNVRGTAGRGAPYERLDDGLGRFASVADAGEALRFIQGRPELDATRVGVFGSRYGGWLALSLMLEFGDRFVVGAVPTALGDLGAYLTQSAELESAVRVREFGDPAEPQIASALVELSPARHLSLLRTPVLLGPALRKKGDGSPLVTPLDAWCATSWRGHCEASDAVAAAQIAAHLAKHLRVVASGSLGEPARPKAP